MALQGPAHKASPAYPASLEAARRRSRASALLAAFGLALGAASLPASETFACSDRLVWSAAALVAEPIVWTPKAREAALEIMLHGSVNVSRTVKTGKSWLALSTLRGRDISAIAERNFRKTARHVVEQFESLALDRATAVELNRMLTEGLVPEEVRGEVNYLLNTEFQHESDAFVGGVPERLYEWLASPAARETWARDPVALAEIIHNNIVALDSFPDGNARSSVDRAARIDYYREIVARGRARFTELMREAPAAPSGFAPTPR